MTGMKGLIPKTLVSLKTPFRWELKKKKSMGLTEAGLDSLRSQGGVMRIRLQSWAREAGQILREPGMRCPCAHAATCGPSSARPHLRRRRSRSLSNCPARPQAPTPYQLLGRPGFTLPAAAAPAAAAAQGPPAPRHLPLLLPLRTPGASPLPPDLRLT